MPRYFFILAYPDQEIGDPHGVIVPSDQTAIEGQIAGRRIQTRPSSLRTKRARSFIGSLAIETRRPDYYRMNSGSHSPRTRRM